MTNTERAPWQRYLGLPYRWGGDPDRDGGTDCLGITLAVLALHDAPRPALNAEWHESAGRGRWLPLLHELDSVSETVPGGRALDVALLDGGAPIALGDHGQPRRWRALASVVRLPDPPLVSVSPVPSLKP
jgi:hypothetical protein